MGRTIHPHKPNHVNYCANARGTCETRAASWARARLFGRRAVLARAAPLGASEASLNLELVRCEVRTREKKAGPEARTLGPGLAGPGACFNNH